jgi:hypothetical protein
MLKVVFKVLYPSSAIINYVVQAATEAGRAATFNTPGQRRRTIPCDKIADEIHVPSQIE